MGSDPQYAKWPLLPLAQQVFTLTNPYASKATQQAAATALQEAIAEHTMAPLYYYLAHPTDGILNQVTGSESATAGSSMATSGAGGRRSQSPYPPGSKPLSRKSSVVGGMISTKSPTALVGMPWDEALYARLKEDNDKELEAFQTEEDEAVEKAGETEIQAARGKRAEFYARVGDKVSNGVAFLATARHA
jgi:26S proteasome regulatory subunit N7